MNFDHVLVEKVEHKGYITLNRSEKLNAMPRQMYEEISAALQTLDQDEDVRVMIVRGAGERAFSAGADLDVLHSVLSGDEFEWVPFRPERFDMGLSVSKPVIAQIHGYCLAGGMELALSCDMRIASDDAIFGAPEIHWSVLHGFGALTLPNLAPLGSVMELLFTGKQFSAAEAFELGIVNRVVSRDDLSQAVDQLASAICNNGPIAVRMIKELILRGRELPLHDGLRLYREMNKLVHQSQDSVEGMLAWKERREPLYTNK